MTGDTLNLLPREDLHAIGYEKLSRIAVRVHILIAAIIGAGAVLLLPTYFFLTFQEVEVVRQIDITKQSAEVHRVNEAETAIQAMNEKLRMLAGTTSPEPVATYFAVVRAETPDGVEISQLSFSRADNGLEVRGTAATREEFLKFLDALRSHALFTNVTSPITNILKDRKLTFTIDMTARTPL